MKNALALVCIAAAAAFCGWEVWRGLTKGVVHVGYGGNVERGRHPLLFWSTLFIWLAFCLLCGVPVIVYGVQQAIRSFGHG